jgi:tetratricopeptide (TPR) repeat protein
MKARTPLSRQRWALRGLACRGRLDPATQTMLLRQLFLAYYDQGHFDRAHGIACQALELDVLPDVMHQDAARARHAAGDVEGAIGHLRLAARVAPPSRRAFHWWTLGSMLFLAGRHEEAIAALGRAARWGTTDKPLYVGHLALAKCHAGQKVRGLGDVIDRLDACPAGQGYGRFVLGQLAYHTSQYEQARRWLEAFVERTRQGRHATQVALRGELAMARATLEAMEEAAS